jgi:hypothetical protein
MLKERDLIKVKCIKGYKTVPLTELDDDLSSLQSCNGIQSLSTSSGKGVSLKILQRTKHPFAS